MEKYFLPILFVFFLGAIFTQFYTFIAVAVTLVVLLKLLRKFGKGIALLEVMAIYSCVIYVLVPILGYSVYTRYDKLTYIWKKYMPVDEITYFSYILPAVIAYLMGLFLTNTLRNRPDEGESIKALVDRIRKYLLKNNWAGMTLISIGLAFFVLKRMMPGSLAFIGNLFYLFTFVGALYIYFQPHFKGKVLAYLVLIVLVFWDAINSGMFTLFFYMSITIVSFFVVGWRIRFHTKLICLAGALLGIVMLQVVKVAFRAKTRKASEVTGRVDMFSNVMIEQTSKVSNIFSKNAFFPVYVRLNQGWTTALVLRRIPERQPYDHGKSIMQSVGASVIPRILWPDKPESGGVYNMQHFAGFKLKGWSTNIGPVGEGYGNFGPAGGIVYMFVFGWFIGYVYSFIISRSRKIPLLILWFPLLYFEVMYSMENDTLQALNSLLKAGFFVWIVYKISPRLFGGGNTTTA